METIKRQIRAAYGRSSYGHRLFDLSVMYSAAAAAVAAYDAIQVLCFYLFLYCILGIDCKKVSVCICVRVAKEGRCRVPVSYDDASPPGLKRSLERSFQHHPITPSIIHLVLDRVDVAVIPRRNQTPSHRSKHALFALARTLLLCRLQMFA